jgi:hypothetical protein
MSYVEYISNSSGGGWWLGDSDWHKLQEAGWKVDWIADEKRDDEFLGALANGDRFLGALATRAKRYGLDLESAVREWESITGQSAADDGCNCCGQPHEFVERGDDGSYLRSVEIVRNNTWTVS